MASTSDENAQPTETETGEVPETSETSVASVAANTADIALDAIPAITKHFRLQFEKAQDSWVLLYPEGMIKLNSAAAEIMQRCDGETSVAKIIAGIEETYAETGLEADIVSFFQMASENKWVTLIPG